MSIGKAGLGMIGDECDSWSGEMTLAHIGQRLALAALKGLDVALARHCVAVKSGLHLRATLPRKGIDILRGAQRQDAEQRFSMRMTLICVVWVRRSDSGAGLRLPNRGLF